MSTPLPEEIENLKKSSRDVFTQFEDTCVEIKKHPTPKAVEDLRITFLGKKGHVSSLMEHMRSIPNDFKRDAGKIVNELRSKVEGVISELKDNADEWKIGQILEERKIDISLPVENTHESGSLHPVTLMRRKIIAEFKKLGFSIYDGPEVESDFYNFSALNFPAEHPARDMQDTFFVEGEEHFVLRTHTSGVQIHAMLAEKPPMRIIAPGRTYRCDSDQTHTPMFHQVEGFVVDTDISFKHLKGTMDTFIKGIFGNKIKTRFRPSFFPFTEPSGEVDMECVICHSKDSDCKVCKGTGWLELGGCGMVHPNVFEAVGIDSENYTGFAFGFGIDRMAMLYYGLTDLRTMFEGNSKFLNQFNIHA